MVRQLPSWRRRLWGRFTLVWASIRYPLGSLVAWAATGIGLISGLAAILAGATTNQTDRETIWGWALVAIAICSFAVFAVQQMRHSKAQIVASTIEQQAHASDILRETRNFLRMHAIAARNGQVVPDDVLGRTRNHVQEVLTQYANIFSATTGTRCRFCIKLIRVRSNQNDLVPKVEDFYLYALARDALSASENKGHDQIRRDKYLDALKDNSDFLRLWSPEHADEGVFFSDDLKLEGNYETSSLNYRWNIQENPNRNRRSDWPLWYVSTIVWPIRQEQNDALGITDDTQHGFLTVDARALSAFDRDIHVSMGRMLSNALFPVLDLYTELLT